MESITITGESLGKAFKMMMEDKKTTEQKLKERAEVEKGFVGLLKAVEDKEKK